MAQEMRCATSLMEDVFAQMDTMETNALVSHVNNHTRPVKLDLISILFEIRLAWMKKFKDQLKMHPMCLALFWAQSCQPDNHIGWATLCPLHQFILLTQGPISKIFAKKYWELGEMKNSIFLIQPFWFLFSEKKIASSQWKLVNIFRIARIFRNFDDYPGFQPQTGIHFHTGTRA